MTGAAVILIGIAALFTMIGSVISGVMLFRIESRARRERERDERMVQIAGDVRSLREGMSEGAQRAFASLAGRVDIIEDEAEQSRERVIEIRERVAALDRTVEGHIRTPHPVAHPHAWPPPAVG